MTPRKYSAEEIKQLLGAPRLIRGERADDYWKWWSAFVELYEPEYLPDWLDVNQLAVKQWEQERLRQCNSAIVDATLIDALKKLLRPLNSLNLHKGINDSLLMVHEIAHDYYFGSEIDKLKARDQVEALAITDDQIMAEALHICAGSLVMFDKLDNNRTNARRALQKELGRRSETRRSRSGENSELQ